MCGRYTLAQGEKIVEAIPNVTIREDLHDIGRWNIAPTQDIFAVANLSPGGVAVAGGPWELQRMRWGLIPSWAKDMSIGSKLINARAETLAEKPAFRKALQRRRCAIPADGFYEWRKNPDGTKTPMYIRLKNHRGFAFAGLWDIWESPEAVLVTCTIITIPPNELLAPINNRMPAILPPEEVRHWLDQKPHEAAEMLSCLKPYPADEMEMYAVSRSVNSATREGPDLIAAAEEPAAQEPRPADDAPARAKAKPPKRKAEDPNQGNLF